MGNLIPCTYLVLKLLGKLKERKSSDANNLNPVELLFIFLLVGLYCFLSHSKKDNVSKEGNEGLSGFHQSGFFLTCCKKG